MYYQQKAKVTFVANITERYMKFLYIEFLYFLKMLTPMRFYILNMFSTYYNMYESRNEEYRILYKYLDETFIV